MSTGAGGRYLYNGTFTMVCDTRTLVLRCTSGSAQHTQHAAAHSGSPHILYNAHTHVNVAVARVNVAVADARLGLA